MPRVKIDYVVSFSSEDPEHPASNLLLREVSKKKWLCKKGESSCSVVLQLPRTVKITGVHVGAYHAALVEVLVGRSETASEEFQVLVPSSVFISREESRRDAPVVRVRSFGAETFSAAARDQRWDRVRLVCSQPHNKHCQFGLSFVHVDQAEGPASSAVPPRLLQLDTFSSDEDDFKPGELFAKHQLKNSGEVQANISSNTGAQIRQATSQALKHKSESSTKLMKTPISTPHGARAPSPAAQPRARDALQYARDDTRPHARIDRVLSQHAAATAATTTRDNTDKLNSTHHKTRQNLQTKDESKMKNDSETKDQPKRTPHRDKNDSPPTPGRNSDKPADEQNYDVEVRKRRRSNSEERSGMQGPARHTLLRGVGVVLSGYQHPHRAAVRELALALGARVMRDWGPGATHLICAFPNTPKLRAARAAAGPDVPVVRADWLQHVSRRGRVLPWRWYATEQKHLIQPTPDQLLDDDDPQPGTRQTQQHPDSDGDTDDEIEKVLQDQKKRQLIESKTSIDDSPSATISDAPPSRDSEDEVSTDEEAPGPRAPAPGPAGPAGRPPGPAGRPPGPAALPDFFDGFTFAIDAAPGEARRMARYVRAYGGLVLPMSDVAEGSQVDYVVRGRGAQHAGRGGAGGGGAGGARAQHVGGGWLARCHAARARLPHSDA